MYIWVGLRPTGYRLTGHGPTGHGPTGHCPTGHRSSGLVRCQEKRHRGARSEDTSAKTERRSISLHGAIILFYISLHFT